MSKDTKTQHFSLWLGIALGLNSVIGAGIFTMPLSLIKVAGPGGIFSIIIAGICVLCMGLGFGRISIIHNGQGNFSSYVQSWGGNILGFLAPLSFILGLASAMGLLCRYICNIASIYMTSFDGNYIGYLILIGIFIATLFASSIARSGQIVLLALTIIPLIIIAGLCMQDFSFTRFTPLLKNGVIGIFEGIPVVLFSFLGFESIMSMTKFFKNPSREIPVATVCTILLTIIVYVTFVGLVIGGVPAEFLITKKTLSEALLFILPNAQWIVHFINASIIITILGTIYAITLALQQLLISSIETSSKGKFVISDNTSTLILMAIMLASFQWIKNMDKLFSIVGLAIAFTYFLCLLYLLIKPATWYDYVIGGFAVSSSLLFIIIAALQLA